MNDSGILLWGLWLCQLNVKCFTVGALNSEVYRTEALSGVTLSDTQSYLRWRLGRQHGYY